MALKKIKLVPEDRIFVRDGNRDGFGCGSVNEDGHLYLIDENKREAYLLPDCYADTPIYQDPHCGGYKDGLIMVSLMGEPRLQYHHDMNGAAGLWGWIDLEGNEVIAPQYVFATHFWEGTAIVCRGEWSVDDCGRYWRENEQWGMIDLKNQEIVPCRYDELVEIDGTDRYMFCHKDGWENGCHCIYDIELKRETLDVHFSDDNGYMFSECYFADNCFYFDECDEHVPGCEEDYISVYSIAEGKWIMYHEPYEERKVNGERKLVVQKDGKEIIVF